jgi:hypothetical protein
VHEVAVQPVHEVDVEIAPGVDTEDGPDDIDRDRDRDDRPDGIDDGIDINIDREAAVADEPVVQPARPRRIDLDLDVRWAPEPATHIDLRDVPAPAEPRWAPEPEPAAELPPARAAASTTSADDDLFELLFADLSKPRRNRRHGERTIPDFEPVHVDDAITLRGS